VLEAVSCDPYGLADQQVIDHIAGRLGRDALKPFQALGQAPPWRLLDVEELKTDLIIMVSWESQAQSDFAQMLACLQSEEPAVLAWAKRINEILGKL